MKSQIVLKAVVFFLYLTFQNSVLLSQSGWYSVNPSPGAAFYTDSKFINPNTGYVTGDFSSILKTTNGGIDWLKIKLPGNRLSISIDITGNNDIIVSCDSGTICRSTDNGTSWSNTNIGIADRLYKVVFTDANTGYTASLYGKIFKTTDAGISWFNVFDTTNCTFFNVQGLNQNIYTCGTSVYRSTNGGVNWMNITDTSLTVTYSVSFISNNIGFASGTPRTYPGGGLLKTTNGGSNWLKVTTIDTENGIKFVYANDENNLVIGTTNRNLYKTTNGGTTWIPILQANNTIWNLSNMGQSGYLLTGNGVLLKSTDSGYNWQSLIRGYTDDLLDIKVVNANTVFACGDNNRILKSSDAGITWQSNKNNNFAQLRDMYFINSNTGFAVGDTNSILKTIDGGNSWVKTTSQILFPFCISFANDNTGIIGGGYGNFLKTTNGGNNWFEITNSPGSAYKVQMLDKNIAYCNNSYLLSKTTNGGLNWISVELNYFSGTRYYGIHFLNENTGYTTNDSGYVCKTTNGGNNWSYQKISEYPLYSIRFADSQTGFSTGAFGNIFKTTNGGVDWIKLEKLYSVSNFGISFLTSNTGFICGDNGIILKTTTGGVSWITVVETTVPRNYELSQNYPNPFNPSTSIKFSIPNSSQVKIAVYDILGKEIEILVNEILQAGNYQIKWNGSSYSSGIYFYQLKSGDYTETKRMVLIK
jgi:photosystem II stability/assembly factor-like uncharacterized protein